MKLITIKFRCYFILIMDSLNHPWRKKNRLVNLYDLFFSDIIPCTHFEDSISCEENYTSLEDYILEDTIPKKQVIELKQSISYPDSRLLYKKNYKCINCPLAHINDLYEDAVNYANNYPEYIAISKLQFIEWNHNQYIKYIENDKIKKILENKKVKNFLENEKIKKILEIENN